MKLKRFFLIGVCISFLCGCSPNTSDESKKGDKKDTESVKELYENLDGRETYEKACEYFKENVSNVKEICTDKFGEYSRVLCHEMFNTNGEYSGILISKSEPEFLYVVYQDAKYFQQVNSDVTQLSEKEQESKYKDRQVEFFSPITKRKNNTDFKTEVINVEREDKDNEIIINIKYKTMSASSLENGEKEWKTDYLVREMYLDNEGLFYKVDTMISDEDFTKLEASSSYKYIDINKRKSFDFDEETKKVKTYNNKTLEEIKEMLKIDNY